MRARIARCTRLHGPSGAYSKTTWQFTGSEVIDRNSYMNSVCSSIGHRDQWHVSDALPQPTPGQQRAVQSVGLFLSPPSSSHKSSSSRHGKRVWPGSSSWPRAVACQASWVEEMDLSTFGYLSASGDDSVEQPCRGECVMQMPLARVCSDNSINSARCGTSVDHSGATTSAAGASTIVGANPC